MPISQDQPARQTSPSANASQGVIGGQNDAFLTKLNATGSALIYSTYLGGNGDDFGRSVAVNVAGSAYVTGVAGANFPTLTPLPTPLASVGFVTKFTPSGAVLYSTLLSGVTASTAVLASLWTTPATHLRPAPRMRVS